MQGSTLTIKITCADGKVVAKSTCLDHKPICPAVIWGKMGYRYISQLVFMTCMTYINSKV